MADTPPLPPGFTLDQPQTAPAQPPVPPLPAGFTLDSAPPEATVGRKVGLAARGVAEGAANAATLVPDTLINNSDIGMMPPPFNAISNAFHGSGQTPISLLTGGRARTFQDLIQQVMTGAGAPVPQTTGEKLTYAAGKGAGAGITGGLSTGASAANAVRAGLSGASGGTAAEGTKLAGGGPLLQFGAGIAGGLAPGILETAGRGVGAMASPFLNRGREEIAGRAIVANTTNAGAAQTALANNTEVVPGSPPTTAEVTRDPGLAQLQTRLRNLEPNDFNRADSARHAARQALLDSMDSTPAAVRTLETRRETVTTPLRDAAFSEARGRPVDTAPLLARVDDLMANPENAGRSVQTALRDVRGQLEGQTDARALYAVRKEINRILEGRYVGADESVLRYAGGQLREVKGAIDDAIQTVAPSWRSYLRSYSDLSRPIDRAQTLTDIRARTGLAAGDLATGAERLSQAKWRDVVSQNTEELAQTLTPQEMANLNRIATDLDRGAAVTAAGSVAGSPTAANMVASDRLTVANLIGQTLGHGMREPNPAVGTIMRPLAWIYQLPEARTRQLIVDAMLDPQLASRLMQRATSQNAEALSQGLLMRAATGGATAVVNTTRSPGSAAPAPQGVARQ